MSAKIKWLILAQIFYFSPTINSYGQEIFNTDDVNICNYANPLTGDKIYSYEATDEAKKIIEKISQMAGLKPNFEIRSSNIPNAAAITKNGKRYIFYNPSFINEFNKSPKKKWDVITILAHEIGHHLQGHTFVQGGSHPAIELEADEFAGFIVRRMDGTRKNATNILENLASLRGTLTHPPRYRRLQAAITGWENADDQSAAASSPRPFSPGSP